MSEKKGDTVSRDTNGADMSNVQSITPEAGRTIQHGASKNLSVNIQDVVVPRCYNHPLPNISIAEIERVRRTGALMMVVVRASLDIPGTYEICFGVTPWRTAILAGLETIDIEIRDWITDDEQKEMLEYEFEQSEEPDPIKEALKIVELKEQEGLNNTEVSKKIGRRREEVSHLLRLLKLDPLVKTWLSDGKITIGHARALVTLKPEDQKKLGKDIIAKKMNVRAVELAAKEMRSGQGGLPEPKTDSNIEYLKNQMAEQLCTEVEISHVGPGGELRIKYYDLEILEGILEKLGINKL